MANISITYRTKADQLETRIQKLIAWLICHWLLIFQVSFGAFVILPFLAPVFMHMGWDGLGKLIYFVYSFMCHQLPERSFFLFGPKGMCSLADIRAAWVKTDNLLILRQFIGTPILGWKVAWSDRMVSLYGGVWIAALLWRPVLRKLKPLSLWGLILLMLPMGLDGSSHFISDLYGIGKGFRDSNAWLAVLTNHVFSPAFYAGDALGSFNSWMRLLTGLVFGMSIIWFTFPYVEDVCKENAQAK